MQYNSSMRLLVAGIITMISSSLWLGVTLCITSCVNHSNHTTTSSDPNPIDEPTKMVILPTEAIKIDYDMANPDKVTNIPIKLNPANNSTQSAAKGTKYVVTAQAFDDHGIAISTKDLVISKEILLFKDDHDTGDIEVSNPRLIDKGFFVIYVNGVQQSSVVQFYLYDANHLLKFDTKDIVFNPNKTKINLEVSLNEHYTDHDPEDTQYEVTAQLLDYNHELFSEDIVSANNKVMIDKHHLQGDIQLEYKNYINKFYLQAGYLLITIKKIAADITANYEQKEQVNFYSDCYPEDWYPKRWEYIAALPSIDSKGGDITLKIQESKSVRLINCWISNSRIMNLHAEGIMFSPTNYFTLNSNQTVLIKLTRDKSNSDNCVYNIGDEEKHCWVNITNI